jgi:hypothetical protein
MREMAAEHFGKSSIAHSLLATADEDRVTGDVAFRP